MRRVLSTPVKPGADFTPGPARSTSSSCGATLFGPPATLSESGSVQRVPGWGRLPGPSARSRSPQANRATSRSRDCKLDNAELPGCASFCGSGSTLGALGASSSLAGRARTTVPGSHGADRTAPTSPTYDARQFRSAGARLRPRGAAIGAPPSAARRSAFRSIFPAWPLARQAGSACRSGRTTRSRRPGSRPAPGNPVYEPPRSVNRYNRFCAPPRANVVPRAARSQRS